MKISELNSILLFSYFCILFFSTNTSAQISIKENTIFVGVKNIVDTNENSRLENKIYISENTIVIGLENYDSITFLENNTNSLSINRNKIAKRKIIKNKITTTNSISKTQTEIKTTFHYSDKKNSKISFIKSSLRCLPTNENNRVLTFIISTKFFIKTNLEFDLRTNSLRTISTNKIKSFTLLLMSVRPPPCYLTSDISTLKYS